MTSSPSNKRIQPHNRPKPSHHLILLFLTTLLLLHHTTSSQQQHQQQSQPLTYHEISSLRARDIKRRLARNHGYSAEEMAKMLDKKELIEALAFEEHKSNEERQREQRRKMTQKGILVAIGAVLVVVFGPLLKSVWEVVCVNFVVYTDKKKYEISRCHSLNSFKGLIGILLLFALDILQIWLSASVLLSWIIPRNQYFFPTPNISVRPTVLLSGAMGGGGGKSSPLDQYGINIGPMMLTWCLRWFKGKVEYWLGNVLSVAHQRQRKEEKKKKKDRMTEEEKRERKERKARRRAEREAAKGMEDMQPTQTVEQEQTPNFVAREYESDVVNAIPNDTVKQTAGSSSFDDVD